ncbi:MAG: choice-of-anchor D domain-containing protein [Leptospirales bacterium]|nr:choice-of-anchor D domain-containing protein [Leptospirales bacterium]
MKAKLKFSGIIVLFTSFLFSMISCGGKNDDVLHFISGFKKTIPTYTVTMKNTGNGIATASHIGDQGPDLGPTIQATKDEIITIGANPDTGSKFVGWHVDSENSEDIDLLDSGDELTISAMPATFKMPAHAVTITAQFDAIPPNTPTPNLVVVPAPVAFDSVRDDYSTLPAAKKVIIRNTGTADATISEVTLGNNTNSAFILISTPSNNTTVTKNGGNITFYVQPASSDRLPAETYKDTITVTYNGGKAETSVEFKVIKTYTVTMDDDGNGTASAARTGALGQTIQAVENEKITIFATPEIGYEFQEWEVVSDNVKLSTTQNPVQFAMPAEDVKIKALFAPIPADRPPAPNLVLIPQLVSFNSVTDDYTTLPPAQWVTIRNVGNADAKNVKVTINSVSFTLNTALISTVAKNGGEEIFTVRPNSDSRLGAGTYNAIITVTSEDGKTAINYVEFEVIKTYSITMQNDGNGLAKADFSRAKQGALISIDATPASGYDFDKWNDATPGGVMLLPSATDNPATFTMRNHDVEIEALFKQLTTPTPVLNLSPSPVHFGSITVGSAQPEAKTVTITNNGTGPANVSSITINSASFKLNGEGSITTVDAGKTANFTVQPNAGLGAGTYNAMITVTYNDGKTATTTVDFTVNATYAIYMQTYGKGTAIAKDGAVTVTSAAKGTVITISETPGDGFKFKEWKVVSGGVTLLSTETSQTFTMPANDVTIMAYFEALLPDTPDLTLSPAPANFGSLAYGYTQPTAAVTITNTGTGTANISSITINSASFKLNGEGSITTVDAGKTANFTVRPNSGLVPGTYSDIITVTYDGGKKATTDVTTDVIFTVTKAPGAAVSAPTYTITYNSITINPVTPPGNGQIVEYGYSTVSTSDGTYLTWYSEDSKPPFNMIFSGLAEGTTYYVYARSAENDYYTAGPLSSVDSKTSNSQNSLGVDFNFSDAEKELQYEASGNLTLTKGTTETVILSVDPAYQNIEWRINGELQPTPSPEEYKYTLNASTFLAPGTYNLEVKGEMVINGITYYYSQNIEFKII